MLASLTETYNEKLPWHQFYTKRSAYDIFDLHFFNYDPEAIEYQA